MSTSSFCFFTIQVGVKTSAFDLVRFIFISLVFFQKKKDEANNETRYIIRGKLKFDSYGRTYIDNATASIVGDINSINITSSIKSVILRKAYKEGNINGVEIKRKLNTNHPLYLQYAPKFSGQ